MNKTLIDRIDALLPQTQCTRCGYEDCRAYAQALADGRDEINRCPPGESGTVQQLATLLGRRPLALDPACGREGRRGVAVVDEAWCIGCRLCIEACPVDAIVGAARRMHTVIAAECTGCELCIAPCPVACIRMLPDSSAPRSADAWIASRAPKARRRYEFRKHRLAKGRQRRLGRGLRGTLPPMSERKAAIHAAVARARNRRRSGRPDGSG